MARPWGGGGQCSFTSQQLTYDECLAGAVTEESTSVLDLLSLQQPCEVSGNLSIRYTYKYSPFFP